MEHKLGNKMRKKEQEEQKNLETSDLEQNVKNDQF